jgi:hypothetical protein
MFVLPTGNSVGWREACCCIASSFFSQVIFRLENLILNANNRVLYVSTIFNRGGFIIVIPACLNYKFTLSTLNCFYFLGVPPYGTQTGCAFALLRYSSWDWYSFVGQKIIYSVCQRGRAATGCRSFGFSDSVEKKHPYIAFAERLNPQHP